MSLKIPSGYANYEPAKPDKKGDKSVPPKKEGKKEPG